MPNDLVTPPELDPNKPSTLHNMPQHGRVSSDHLGIGGGLEQEGIFASLWANLHDAFFPPKLPPLELTSKPIPVPDRMKVKRSPASTATAVVIHALIILLIAFLLAKKVLKFAAPAKVTTVDLSTPPIAPLAANSMGGGGSNHDTTPVTQGKLPPPVKNPIVPVMKPMIEHPIIAAPPALVIQPMKLPNTNLPDFGNPNGPKVAGPGSAGNNGGGGIGTGNGDGLGTGTGGNCCSGVYQVGGGVSAPVITYGPEAEFSDEARRAKYQGDVNVDIVVGTDGLVKYARVVRDPGMGLAEKALEAVRTYKFKPAMKDGKPVAVHVTIEVGFTIY
jgi:protein TonB